jgi:hypothetical protein
MERERVEWRYGRSLAPCLGGEMPGLRSTQYDERVFRLQLQHSCWEGGAVCAVVIAKK